MVVTDCNPFTVEEEAEPYWYWILVGVGALIVLAVCAGGAYLSWKKTPHQLELEAKQKREEELRKAQEALEKEAD